MFRIKVTTAILCISTLCEHGDHVYFHSMCLATVSSIHSSFHSVYCVNMHSSHLFEDLPKAVYSVKVHSFVPPILWMRTVSFCEFTGYAQIHSMYSEKKLK